LPIFSFPRTKMQLQEELSDCPFVCNVSLQTYIFLKTV
jgi:hypothetical protein